jgi:hypothetical protein
MSEQMGTGATGTRTTRTVGSTEVRGRSDDTFADEDLIRENETKPSFMTSEFWVSIAAVAALIITYNVANSPELDLWRTSLLCVAIGVAYVVSRGIAKAGSHRRHEAMTLDRPGMRTDMR